MEMTISSRTQTKGMDSEDVSPRTDIISGRDYYHFKEKPPSSITICTHVSVLQIYLLWRGGGIRIGEDIKSSNSKVLLKKLLFVCSL